MLCICIDIINRNSKSLYNCYNYLFKIWCSFLKPNFTGNNLSNSCLTAMNSNVWTEKKVPKYHYLKHAFMEINRLSKPY